MLKVDCSRFSSGGKKRMESFVGRRRRGRRKKLRVMHFLLSDIVSLSRIAM